MVRVKPAGVMAADTADKGTCVVANATRRGCSTSRPSASIITTWSTPANSARYSVCPVKAMPASLMVPLCTGAVTMAANVPFFKPNKAMSKVFNTYGALPTSNSPKFTGANNGQCQTTRMLAFSAALMSSKVANALEGINSARMLKRCATSRK